MPAPIENAALRSLVGRALQLTDAPGRDELLAQVPGLTYMRGPVTMMDVSVDRTCPAASIPSPFSIKPSAFGRNGEPIGGLLLWLDADGYMDCVEYLWFTDEMPSELPAADQLH